MASSSPPRRLWLLAAALLSACAAGDGVDRPALRGAAPEVTGAFGSYLAGRFATNEADTKYAADSLLQALRRAPNEPEVVQRAFIATLLDGRSEAGRLARVIPKGDVSIVAAPYGAGDARVAEILVTEGDRVEKGAPVARLDNRAALESAVLMAEANLAIREATLMQIRAAITASRDEAQATLDQAVATAAEANTNLTRTEELFKSSVATRATLDNVRTSCNCSQCQLR